MSLTKKTNKIDFGGKNTVYMDSYTHTHTLIPSKSNCSDVNYRQKLTVNLNIFESTAP